MSEIEPSDETKYELPPEVVAELRARTLPDVAISEDVDQAVLADARQILSARPSKRLSRWRQWTLGLVSVGSLAAALLIFVWPQMDSPEAVDRNEMSVASGDAPEAASADSAPLMTAAFRKEDIDHDGRVDILDAFALARQLEDPQSSPTNGDQNGDGVFDEDDVSYVALTAVML